MRKIALQLLVLVGLFCISFSLKASEPDWLYTVKPNDTFYSIYRAYLAHPNNIARLSAHNHHKLTKILLPGQVLQIPVAMLKKIPAPVQVLVASGDVIKTSLAIKDEQKLKKGEVLAEGDTLKTGKYSVAKLGFADGSMVDVQQNSQIEIVNSYQYVGKSTYVTLLKLVKGRTEIGANPNHAVGNAMRVQTPSAIAAVRGTHFRVNAEENVALQETLEGKVAFSAAGKEVMLAQGYGSIAENGKAPLPPIALPGVPDISSLPTQLESEQGQVTFELKPQADSVARVGQLAQDAQFSQIINEQTTTKNQLTFTVPDGTYFLRLRAQESHGLQGADAIHAFNVKTKAPLEIEQKFTLIAPANAEVIALAPTLFSWSAVPQAQQYQLQIARDAHFKELIFEQSSNENQLTIRQSFGKGQYYWRVIAVVHNKPQKPSDFWQFSR